MSTVSSVLNGVRYDLRNYSDIDFDSDLMIHYLNRAIRTLDYTLGSHNSDQTLNKDTVTLSEDDDTVSVPTNAFNIREVWIDEDRKENLGIMEIYYKSEFRESETAEPSFWAHDGETIRFEVAADDDYIVTVYYDKLSTTLTAESDTMPYGGRYDDAMREAVVLLCQAKKYKSPSQADAAYAQIFENIVKMDIVNRGFKKKNYRLDF
jgi:hypothetical protein